MADQHDSQNTLDDAIPNRVDEPGLPTDHIPRAGHGPALDAAKGLGQVLDGLPGGDTYIPPQNDRPPPGEHKAI